MSESYPIWLKSYRNGFPSDGLVTPLVGFTPQTESIQIELTGSVGKGGDNNPSDVQKIEQRLEELGFNKPAVYEYSNGRTNIGYIPTLIDQIKLFQAIINGKSTKAGDGLVEVDGKTHDWLRAANAPKWIKVQDINGPGWFHLN